MSSHTDGPGDDPDAEDRRLLAAHIDGDVDAFGYLARRHYDRLWPVALRICRDPQDAEDALQDALISAMRRADSFRGDARVTTWLHRIVVNACLDRLRRNKRATWVELPDDAGPGALPDTVDRVEQQETRLDVSAALARLPDDQRAAVVLVEIEGYPVAEAAAILGVPEGTVKSRCYRARVRLARELTQSRNQQQTPGVQPGTGETGSIAPRRREEGT